MEEDGGSDRHDPVLLGNFTTGSTKFPFLVYRPSASPSSKVTNPKMNILKKHSHCQSYQPVQADAQADEEESECNERPFAALATPVSRRNMLQFFTIICLLVSNLILIIALASSHAGPILPSSTTGYSQPERNKARKQVSSYCNLLLQSSSPDFSRLTVLFECYF